MMKLSNTYPSNDPDWVAEVHATQYLQSWSKQGVKPPVITGAQGSWFWDSNGKRYLDFESQLVNLNMGHQHPRIVQAIKDQADKLCYIGPAMGSDVRSELAAMVADITPTNLTATFFTTGGAAANETAIRLARHFTGRSKIVARYRSYHDPPGAPFYRPQQDSRPLSQLSRINRWCAQPDGRTTPSSHPFRYAGCGAHAGPLCLSQPDRAS